MSDEYVRLALGVRRAGVDRDEFQRRLLSASAINGVLMCRPVELSARDLVLFARQAEEAMRSGAMDREIARQLRELGPDLDQYVR